MVGTEQDNIHLSYVSAYDSDGSDWLACPHDNTNSSFAIYPKKAYDAHGSFDDCITFEVRTKQVETPKEVCVFN